MENEGRDPLTGAYTRGILQARMEEELAQARRLGTHLSILMLDVDYFKSINDAFGHAAGDEALKGLAQRMRALTRKGDLLFRYGGDEFVLLMPGTGAHQVPHLCRRLLHSLETQPFENIQPPLTLGISGGTATFPTDGEDIETLFAVADKRHYIAKRQGRGRIITSDQPLPGKQHHITPPDRLIGHDEALKTAQSFLETLQAQQHAVLQVVGEKGMGEDVLLRNIERLARLQGYLTLQVHALPGMQHRAYGAILEAQVAGISAPPGEWEDITDLQGWISLAREKRARGWLITVRNWNYLDTYSQALLERLFNHPTTLATGVVYTAHHLPVWKHRFPWNATPREEITLSPLTLLQTQAWLRQVLAWDPPAGFVQWLHHITAGKPGFFLSVLQYLQASGMLTFLGEGQWAINLEDIVHLSLEDILPSEPPVVAPAVENTFIGHHETIAQLKKRLLRERLLTLVAPGGTGKTRLATQILLETGGQFQDGAYFVALDGVTSSRHIPEEIANTLNLSITNHLPLEDAVCAALQDKHILLVLDNFEHLLSGAPYVQKLLQETEGVHILVTSRLPLNLPEEQRIFLQGLRLPPQNYTLRSFHNAPAVQFLVHCLQQQVPDYTVTPEHQPLIVRLCHLSGGMPLALQMIAAWMPIMPLEEIQERMEKSLGMLVLQHNKHPRPQHSSIRTTFLTLWDILTEYEQRTMVRLAIFPASFSTSAARKIANISIFFLDGLVQRALLWRLPNQRYQCHPLLSQFLTEMAEPAELEKLRESFIDFYTDFAVQVAGQWKHVPRQQSKDAITMEMDNLRQAWDWALAGLRFGQLDKMLPLLHHYYEHNGWFQEAYATFTNLHTYIEEHLHEEIQPDAYLLNAHTLLAMGKYAYHLGLYEAALQHLEQSKAYLEETGTLEDTYTLLDTLSSVNTALGAYQAVLEQREKCLEIARHLGRPDFLAESLARIAIIQYYQRDFDSAEQYFKQALQYYRQENDETRITAMLNNLGNVAYERGAYSEALTYLEDCLVMAEKVEGQALLASVLDSLGKVLIAMGKYQEAWQQLQRGLYICQKINAIPLAMELVINVGTLAAAVGDRETAALAWQTAANHPRTLESVRTRSRHSLEKHGLSSQEFVLPSLKKLISQFHAALDEIPSKTTNDHSSSEAPAPGTPTNTISTQLHS